MVVHWLPIRCHIDFKLCTIMYGIHTGICLAYVTPQLRIKFREHTFSHAGPAAWHSVPPDIYAAASPAIFKKLLKMHFFNTAFSTC